MVLSRGLYPEACVLERDVRTETIYMAEGIAVAEVPAAAAGIVLGYSGVPPANDDDTFTRLL
jgi:hypothetical protein